MVRGAKKSSVLDIRLYRALGTLVVCIVLVIVVAIIGLSNKTDPEARHPLISQDEQEKITARLLDNMKRENILQNLKALTTMPHPAGTPENKKVAEKIAEIWTQNGLQDVHFIKYNVLLSYPDYSNPNQVSILDSDGRTIYKSTGVSPPIIKEEQSAPGAGIQWLAYAGNGTVEGDLVYAHYGTKQDFKILEEMGVSVESKIVIMRYHTDFRGAKVMQAQLRGAIGAILYSDPAEMAQEGTSPEDVYPSKVWLPPNGVQRGSLVMADGDVLTPLYPARSDQFPRRTIEEAKADHILPSIPALPIGYSDAYQLLSRLGGQRAPADWQGGLNLTYNLGPGFNSADGSQKLRVEVRSSLEIREIQNVIGYIHGSEEPDEYVILGNHYDAWVYGSIDPNSATATLAEVGRAFTQTMQQTGWRPARTIMFCAWDAEEFGVIGSTEFVQDFQNILSDRAVVYLNGDLAVKGNGTLNADTVPTMFKAVVDASRKVPNPMESELDKGRKTVYDTWLDARPPTNPERPDYPRMKVPGGGSDHHSFLVYLGIPVVHFLYTNKTEKSHYPLYHSLYETPWTNEHLIDTNNFAVHRAVGQFWAELARSFADAPILPLNISEFSQILLNSYISDLSTAMEPFSSNTSEIKDASEQLIKLTNKAKEFGSRANKFESEIFEWRKVQWHTPESKRHLSRINKRLKAVDRCFVNPRGMDSGPAKRHVLFSLSATNTYAGVVMAAVYDELDKFVHATTHEEREKAGRALAIQISTVQYSVQCATNTLESII